MKKYERNTEVAKMMNDAIAGKITTADFITAAVPMVEDVVGKFNLKYADMQDVQQELCMYLLERVKKGQGLNECSYGFLQMQLENQVKRRLRLTSNTCRLGQANGIYDDLDMDEHLFRSEIHDKVHFALSKLTEREQKVLEMRYGLNESSEMTLAEVGSEIGVSANRVRQIEVKALHKLRHPSTNTKLKDLIQ